MGPVIADEVDRKINALQDVESVNVELVWEPQWNQGMMSEAAQLERAARLDGGGARLSQGIHPH